MDMKVHSPMATLLLENGYEYYCFNLQSLYNQTIIPPAKLVALILNVLSNPMPYLLRFLNTITFNSA